MASGSALKQLLAACAGVVLLTAAPAGAQNYSDGYKFLQAVEKHDQATVQQLFDKNATVVDARDIADGHTGLHTVVKGRDTPWLRYLLTLGTNPNIADKQGVTPLMLASQLGYLEGVTLLAEKGAKPDVGNDAGETPLISAVHARDLPMVRILIAAGADPDRTDNSGRSARDYAKQMGASSPLLDALNGTKRKKSSGQTYGPTF